MLAWDFLFQFNELWIFRCSECSETVKHLLGSLVIEHSVTMFFWSIYSGSKFQAKNYKGHGLRDSFLICVFGWNARSLAVMANILNHESKPTLVFDSKVRASNLPPIIFFAWFRDLYCSCFIQGTCSWLLYLVDVMGLIWWLPHFKLFKYQAVYPVSFQSKGVGVMTRNSFQEMEVSIFTLS